MSTRIEINYDRTYTDADLQAIASRSAATVNVLEQLGELYQNLPGYKMTDYETEANSLEADMVAVNGLVDQIRVRLVAMDAKARPLDEKNKGALKALSGLLQTDAQNTLLTQITGPTPQGGSSTATTTPVTPP